MTRSFFGPTGAEVLFFACPKKSTQKKGHPPRRAACGSALAGRGVSGLADGPSLARCQFAASLRRPHAAHGALSVHTPPRSARRKGMGKHPHSAHPCGDSWDSSLKSKKTTSFPSNAAAGHTAGKEDASRCLSISESRRAPRQPWAQGHRAATAFPGPLFFGYFLLAGKRKYLARSASEKAPFKT